MSDLKATVAERPDGFHVEGYEKIEYDFVFLDNIFSVERSDLADCYKQWGRCLAIMDANIFNVYGEQMRRYFEHYSIPLDVHKTMIGEKAKSIETFLSIVDSMTKFGIYRKVRQMELKIRCDFCMQCEVDEVLGACAGGWWWFGDRRSWVGATLRTLQKATANT